eukprot:2570566-Rhodomonas_salina.2
MSEGRFMEWARVVSWNERWVFHAVKRMCGSFSEIRGVVWAQDPNSKDTIEVLILASPGIPRGMIVIPPPSPKPSERFRAVLYSSWCYGGAEP